MDQKDSHSSSECKSLGKFSLTIINCIEVVKGSDNFSQFGLDAESNFILSYEHMRYLSMNLHEQRNARTIKDLVQGILEISECFDNYISEGHFVRLIYLYSLFAYVIAEKDKENNNNIKRKVFVDAKKNLYDKLRRDRIFLPRFITHYDDGQSHDVTNPRLKTFLQTLQEEFDNQSTILHIINLIEQYCVRNGLSLDIPVKFNLAEPDEVLHDKASRRRSVSIKKAAEICNFSISTIKKWLGTHGKNQPACAPPGFPGLEDEGKLRSWAIEYRKIKRGKKPRYSSISERTPEISDGYRNPLERFELQEAKAAIKEDLDRIIHDNSILSPHTISTLSKLNDAILNSSDEILCKILL